MWLVARGSEAEEEADGGVDKGVDEGVDERVEGGVERGVERGVEWEDGREEWVGVGWTERLMDEEEGGEDPTHFAYQTCQSL